MATIGVQVSDSTGSSGRRGEQVLDNAFQQVEHARPASMNNDHPHDDHRMTRGKYPAMFTAMASPAPAAPGARPGSPDLAHHR